jgi:glycosyltransferase involved in cell wall biosynthesis
VKNLELTVIALQVVCEQVEFDHYGPLEDAHYWSKCRSLIGQLPIHVQVTYGGELLSSDLPRFFSHYDAFVVPTLGENFGHAIAESLSASCPVACSDQTPWTEVLEGGGGVVVRHQTSEAFGKELRRFVALTPAERLEAGHAAGRAYRSWRHNMVAHNILEEARLIDRT